MCRGEVLLPYRSRMNLFPTEVLEVRLQLAWEIASVLPKIFQIKGNVNTCGLDSKVVLDLNGCNLTDIIPLLITHLNTAKLAHKGR